MKKNKQHKRFDRNHLKFEFDDVTFETEGDTIHCFIKGWFTSTWPLHDVVERVFKREQFSEVDLAGQFDIDTVIGWSTFESIVKCNDNDKYDETVGKRIAESKCKAKIYVKALKLISEIAEESEKEIEQLKNVGAKYLGYYAKERMHQFKVDYGHNGDTAK
jgi:hypothetical protein